MMHRFCQLCTHSLIAALRDSSHGYQAHFPRRVLRAKELCKAPDTWQQASPALLSKYLSSIVFGGRSETTETLWWTRWLLSIDMR